MISLELLVEKIWFKVLIQVKELLLLTVFFVFRKTHFFVSESVVELLVSELLTHPVYKEKRETGQKVLIFKNETFDKNICQKMGIVFLKLTLGLCVCVAKIFQKSFANAIKV